MRRVTVIGVLVGVLLTGLLGGGSPAQTPPARDSFPSRPQEAGCPTSADPARFPTAGEIRALNREMFTLGPRPTGSRAHNRYLGELERDLAAIRGMRIEAIRYELAGWRPHGARLAVRSEGGRARLPLAGPVPYTAPTGRRGVRAPLVYLPPGEEITQERVAGKILIRDVPVASTPYAAFAAMAYYLPPQFFAEHAAASYEREFLSSPKEELKEAIEAGAVGAVFGLEFPRKQMRGHYLPYDGVLRGVPAVYVGVDERERLKRLAERGGASARLTLRASRPLLQTRTLEATLPGASDVEPVIFESHTDGVNAVWDNGPPGMIALARYFASLPRGCRPRPIKFVFATAHLYTSRLGSEDHAHRLDQGYDSGSVHLVANLEHLGALEYLPLPRANGPGRRLAPSDEQEVAGWFVPESPALIDAVIAAVQRRALGNTAVLRGLDVPGPHMPLQCHFGGEGQPYRHHIIPTTSVISGPNSLFNPAFGMEAIDFELFRRQVLALADVAMAVDDLPRVIVAGADNLYRPARDLGLPACRSF